MTVFLTEKSYSGLCSALYFAFTEKITPDLVCGRETCVQKNLTDLYITIAPETDKASRVSSALQKYGGIKTVNSLKICLLLGEDSALKTAFDFAFLTLCKRRDVINMLAEKEVSELLYTVKKVLNERHKFKGFIRFKETASGILYAAYSPDNDITEILCPHFIKRLYDLPFIIHDVKRNKAGVSNGRTFKMMTTENRAVLNLSEDEKAWEELWKNYYKAVNIKERKNKKQQDNLMPVRYRKFLPETYE